MRKVVVYGLGGFVGVCVILAVLGVIGNAIKEKTGSTSASEGAATVAVSRCRPASPELVSALRDSLVSGVTLTDVQTVRSNDYSKVWFVAGLLSGEGIPSHTIALWATNDTTAMAGTIYSVNGEAQEFSDWGHPSAGPGADLSVSDDGAKDAIRCAR